MTSVNDIKKELFRQGWITRRQAADILGHVDGSHIQRRLEAAKVGRLLVNADGLLYLRRDVMALTATIINSANGASRRGQIAARASEPACVDDIADAVMRRLADRFPLFAAQATGDKA